MNMQKQGLDASWQEMKGKGTSPHTILGNIQAMYGLYSPQLFDKRDIFVYLPPSYAGGSKRYPAIYMQDGQNLFDQAISHAGEWGGDETLERLSIEGVEAIIVGIANGGERRMSEYNPYQAMESGNAGENAYLDFVIDTVKPLIDQTFRTRPERGATGIIGSSMGGLVSLYAFFRFPHVFGFAGAMSHWMWVKDQVSPDQVCGFLARSKYSQGKLYIDIGDQEMVDHSLTGIKLSPGQAIADTRRLKDTLVAKGYEPGKDLLYREIPGGAHAERDWSLRLADVFRFLLSA